jgi:hypothetical protein
MIQQHQRAMFFAQQFFRNASFPVTPSARIHKLVECCGDVRHLENECGFSPRHFRLEPAFVETASEGSGAAAGPAERDEGGAALLEGMLEWK